MGPDGTGRGKTMAKVRVCDVCRKDGKLQETNRYLRIKGFRELSIDVCESCKSNVPKAIEYIKLAYASRGMELDEPTIRMMYGGKIRGVSK